MEVLIILFMPYSNNNGNYFVSTYSNSDFNLPRLVPLDFDFNYRPYY